MNAEDLGETTVQKKKKEKNRKKDSQISDKDHISATDELGDEEERAILKKKQDRLKRNSACS